MRYTKKNLLLVGSRLAPQLGVPSAAFPSSPCYYFGVRPLLVAVECPLGTYQEDLVAFGYASYFLEVALFVLLVLQRRRLRTQ